MGNDAGLDVGMVGGELAADVFAVGRRLAMQIRIARASGARGHVTHPEVVGIGAQPVDGVLEADLNLESHPV